MDKPIDFFAGSSTPAAPALSEEDAASTAESIRTLQTKPKEVGTGRQLENIVKDTITYSMLENFGTSTHASSDPNYTFDDYKADFEEARKHLPESHLHYLEGARSREAFDSRFNLAYSRAAREEDLSLGGWGVQGARFVAAIADPATFVTFAKAAKLAVVASDMLKFARGGQNVMNTLGGGLGGGLVTAERQALGYNETPESYALSVSLGSFIGYLTGPLSGMPEVKTEVGMLRKNAEKAYKGVVDRWQKFREQPAAPESPPSGPPQAAVERAAQATEDGVYNIKEPATAPAPERAPSPAPAEPTVASTVESALTTPKPATEAAIQHITEALQKGGPIEAAPIAQAAEELAMAVTPKVAEAAPTAPKAPPMLTEAGGHQTVIEKLPSENPGLANKPATPRAAGDLKDIKAQAAKLQELRAKPEVKAGDEPWRLSKEELAALKDRMVQEHPENKPSPKDLRKAKEDLEAERQAAYEAADVRPELAPQDPSAFFEEKMTDPRRLDAFRQIVTETFNRIVPDGWVLKLHDSERVPGTTNTTGRVRLSARLVEVALGNPRPVQSIYHEAIHVIRNMGLFTEAEWRVLTKTAKTMRDRYWESWRMKAYRAHYGEGPKSDMYVQEEGVAFLIGERGDIAFKKSLGVRINKLLDRIEAFFSDLGAKLRGDPSFEEVFSKIDSGEIARRNPQSVAPNRAHDSPWKPWALEDYPDMPEIEKAVMDGDFDSLVQADAPQGRFARWLRISKGGRVSTSVVVPERLIGSNLLVDSVAMDGGHKTPISADQVTMQYVKKWVSAWNETKAPAFSEWADDLHLSNFERLRREDEFYRLVGDRIRDTSAPGAYHPAVERAATKMASLFKDILEHLKNPLKDEGGVGRAIDVAGVIPEDAHYLWRMHNYEHWHAAIETHGYDAVVDFWKDAILAARRNLSDAQARTIAEGYIGNVIADSFGLGDHWSIAIAKGDRESLKRILTTQTRLQAHEIDDVMNRVLGNDEPAAGMENMKRRMLVNEMYQDPATGLHVSDFLENNADLLFQRYARRAAGRVALGGTRVRLADGTVLIDGFATQAEIDRAIENTKLWGAHNGISPVEIGKSADRLKWAFDNIQGIPPAENVTAKFALQLLRKYMTTTKMGQVGFAQVGESMQPIANLGLRACLKKMPSLKRMVDPNGDFKFTNELMQDLEVMLGLGAEQLHGYRLNNLDETGVTAFNAPGAPMANKVMQVANAAERATYDLSLMNWLQRKQEAWTASSVLNRLATLGATLKSGGKIAAGDLKRVKWLNLDEIMMERIFNQMRQHGDVSESYHFGPDVSVNSLRLNSWTDLEARVALERAVFRQVRKTIQTGDLGSMAMWMDSELARTFFQFRGFSFTAWENNFLHNIHVGDPRAYIGFASAVAWNSLVRAAQIKLMASARSDGAEYQDKNLTAWELSKAGFQRAGWSSIMPMVIDSVVTPTTGAGMFNARSSGQPSNILFGSPAFSSWDAINQGLGGTLNDLWSGRRVSQTSARNAFSAVPFSNHYLPALFFSWMIQDRPTKSPRVSTH